MRFQEKLDKIVRKNNSLVCVGLDSDSEKIKNQFKFNERIINQTYDLVCAYKPNSAFYEARGSKGIKDLKLTCDFIRKKYPDIPIILDAKRGDIGSTNEGYIKFAFEYLGVDALTLHPYLGEESLKPFLVLKDKGFFILCRTSNPGAGELQDFNDLYKTIAKHVVVNWNKNGNCMLVVGATYPAELKEIRKIVGDMTLLIPGVGEQGGDLEKTVKFGLNSKGKGIIVNSSRKIIFSGNPRAETEKLRNEILKFI